MTTSKGSFKNISLKALDSDGFSRFSNASGNDIGAIKFSNLFFSYGDGEDLRYPDSDVFTNSSTPIFTPLPVNYRPDVLNDVFLQAVVGTGVLSPYLDDSSPDDTPYGDLSGNGSFNVTDVNVLSQLSFTPSDASLSPQLDSRFGYYFGKGGATKMPGLTSDVRLSMFKGITRHYARSVTQTETQTGGGFGYRVKLSTKSGFLGETLLWVANPYHNGSRGMVEVYEINLDGSITRRNRLDGATPGGYFGYSIDADGDYVIVGEPFSGTNNAQGNAYVYDYNGTLIRTFNPVNSYRYFGSVVAINSKLDRVAIGDQFPQNTNDATYGYQIGAVELNSFKSSDTQIAYLQNPNRETIGFGDSTTNVWYFGCNAFGGFNAQYTDGVLSLFSAQILGSYPPGTPGGAAARGMHTITFGGEYLYVGAVGGSTLTGRGRVYRFNASDGSYVSLAEGPTTSGGGYGSAIDADSDGVFVGSQLQSLYGGQVHLESLALSEQDALRYDGMNSLQDWGFDESTNSAKFGRYVSKSKKHLAVWSGGPNNGPSVGDDWIGIFPATGSTSFNSILKAFTSTAFENSNKDISSTSYIGDLDIHHNETLNRSYLAVGLPTTTFSGQTYQGGVLLYDIDNAITDITVTGEEPTA